MSQTLQVCQNVDDAAEKDEATEVLQSDDFQNSPLTWIGREILQKGDALQVATVLTSGCRGFLMCLELFSTSSGKKVFFMMMKNWVKIGIGSQVPESHKSFLSGKALCRAGFAPYLCICPGRRFVSFAVVPVLTAAGFFLR
jgi:hypothetical protein